MYVLTKQQFDLQSSRKTRSSHWQIQVWVPVRQSLFLIDLQLHTAGITWRQRKSRTPRNHRPRN